MAQKRHRTLVVVAAYRVRQSFKSGPDVYFSKIASRIASGWVGFAGFRFRAQARPLRKDEKPNRYLRAMASFLNVGMIPSPIAQNATVRDVPLSNRIKLAGGLDH